MKEYAVQTQKIVKAFNGRDIKSHLQKRDDSR